MRLIIFSFIFLLTNAQDVSTNPSLEPTTDLALVVCASQKCVAKTTKPITEFIPVESTNQIGVRCCANKSLPGFTNAKPGCGDLWVSSMDGNGRCIYVGSSTFYQGKALCESQGARLCTLQENLGDCTRPAKCGTNHLRVWSEFDNSLIINKNNTSSPTPYPTYFPTEEENAGPTIEPTIRTDTPTTGKVVMCPNHGSTPVSVSAGSIVLQVSDSLCTLTKVTTSIETGEITSIPVARSYDNNPWEKSASSSVSMFGKEEILCYPVGCQMQLSELESGAEYMLSSFSHSLSKTDEYARFLETATFGTTQQQLDVFTNSPKNVQETIASWLTDQMNPNVTNITSHRAYWRRGLNGRVRGYL